MALTIQQLYDVALLGGSWRFSSANKPFRLGTTIYALVELGLITRAEAAANLAKIVKKGLPKPLIRLKFDQQVVLCVARPGLLAENAFQNAIATSPKHLAVLPPTNSLYFKLYGAVIPIAFN